MFRSAASLPPATLVRPRYWPGHLAMLICVGIALSLGLWQLDAWQTRRADAARDLSTAPPVELATVMTGDSPFPGRSLGRPVTFTGSWVPRATVFISDRYLDQRRGFWVVTPVLVDGDTSAIPVVRGWSADPQAPEPVGEVDVTGWLQATEGSGPIDPDPADDIIPMMRLASLVEYVPEDLYSGYVVAQDLVSTGPSAGNGASADLEAVTPAAIPEVSGFTALRNFLYAVEWWVFGLFAFVVWVRWCRDSLEVPSAAVDEDPETDA